MNNAPRESFEPTRGYSIGVEDAIDHILVDALQESQPGLTVIRSEWKTDAKKFVLVETYRGDDGERYSCNLLSKKYTEEGLIEHRTYDWRRNQLQTSTNYMTAADELEIQASPVKNAEAALAHALIFDGFNENAFPSTPEEYMDFLDDLFSFAARRP